MKPCDFGLAKRFKLAHAKERKVCGPLVHIPPEVYQGQHASYETDIFALGMLFYQIIVSDIKMIYKLFGKAEN